MQTDATNYNDHCIICFTCYYHLKIGEIWVFVDISISPFNFANMSSKYITNLSASNVALQTLHKVCCLWKSDAMTCNTWPAMQCNDMQLQWHAMQCNAMTSNEMTRNAMTSNEMTRNAMTHNAMTCIACHVIALHIMWLHVMLIFFSSLKTLINLMHIALKMHLCGKWDLNFYNCWQHSTQNIWCAWHTDCWQNDNF